MITVYCEGQYTGYNRHTRGRRGGGGGGGWTHTSTLLRVVLRALLGQFTVVDSGIPCVLTRASYTSRKHFGAEKQFRFQAYIRF